MPCSAAIWGRQLVNSVISLQTFFKLARYIRFSGNYRRHTIASCEKGGLDP